MPITGGTYTVNVVASVSGVTGLTNFGLQSGYFGALSAVLNGNLGNGTLDGDVTDSTLFAA